MENKFPIKKRRASSSSPNFDFPVVGRMMIVIIKTQIFTTLGLPIGIFVEKQPPILTFKVGGNPAAPHSVLSRNPFRFLDVS
jgi:hypothetical protein